MVAAPGLFDKVVDFVVPGMSVPKQRPRVVTVKGRVLTYTPKHSVAWEKTVRLMAMSTFSRERTWRTAGAFGLHVIVQTHRKPPKRGDIDNHAKNCMDALNGVAWDDDALVEEVRASFQACETEDDCCMFVRVWRKE